MWVTLTLIFHGHSRSNVIVSLDSHYMPSYCGVARFCGLCFNSLALCWTRGISLRGTTPQEVTFYGHMATWFIFNREPLQKRLSPWRDGTGRTESRDWPRLTLSLFRRPEESLRAVSDLTRETGSGCEYPKGLGHHASGYEFELETPPRPLLIRWEKKWQQETDLT